MKHMYETGSEKVLFLTGTMSSFFNGNWRLTRGVIHIAEKNASCDGGDETVKRVCR